jgi:hypothetical protein
MPAAGGVPPHHIVHSTTRYTLYHTTSHQQVFPVALVLRVHLWFFA